MRAKTVPHQAEAGQNQQAEHDVAEMLVAQRVIDARPTPGADQRSRKRDERKPDHLRFDEARCRLQRQRSCKHREIEELEDAAPFDRLFDSEWSAANARRLVDRLGTLLEIAWMGELAAQTLDRSAALALLTSFARFRLLPTDRLFNHPILEELLENAEALIDEKPFMADCGQI